MTPIPLTETQMAELFRLRAENATLQTEIAELRIRMNAYQQAWNSDELEKSLSVENAALKEQVAQLIEINNNLISHRTEQYETITQQADVIEQMREALRHYAYRAGQDWQIAREALALQPSPEILQARDEQVAEACCKVVDAHYDECEPWLDSEMLRAEWRKYL